MKIFVGINKKDYIAEWFYYVHRVALKQEIADINRARAHWFFIDQKKFAQNSA